MNLELVHGRVTLAIKFTICYEVTHAVVERPNKSILRFAKRPAASTALACLLFFEQTGPCLIHLSTYAACVAHEPGIFCSVLCARPPIFRFDPTSHRALPEIEAVRRLDIRIPELYVGYHELKAIGQVPRPALARLLARCDLVLLPHRIFSASAAPGLERLAELQTIADFTTIVAAPEQNYKHLPHLHFAKSYQRTRRFITHRQPVYLLLRRALPRDMAALVVQAWVEVERAEFLIRDLDYSAVLETAPDEPSLHLPLPPTFKQRLEVLWRNPPAVQPIKRPDTPPEQPGLLRRLAMWLANF